MTDKTVPRPEPDMQTDPCSADGTQTGYYTASTVRQLLAAERERMSAEFEASAELLARSSREAEAAYWRSMIERATAQADEWGRRYQELLRHIAELRSMVQHPAVVVVTPERVNCDTPTWRDGVR